MSNFPSSFSTYSLLLERRVLWSILSLGLIVCSASLALGQGGAAISVGLSVQDSANAAARQSSANAASANNASRQSAAPPANASAAPPSSDSYLSQPEEYSSEYEAEYGYDNGATGPGGRAARGGNVAGGDVLSFLTNSLANSLAEKFNRPLSESATRFKPNLYEQAALALHLGDQRQALALFHAHLVAEREAATAHLDSVGFSPLLRKPVWALRLGVSINAKVPSDMADDPEPIRDGEKAKPNRGDGGYEFETSESDIEPRGGLAAGNRSSALEESAANPDGSLEEMEMSGEFGETGGRAARAAPEGLPSTPGGSGSEAADELIDRHLGMIAEVLKSELTKRISGGKFGSALADLAPRGAALAAQVSSAPGLGQSGGTAVMWIPGVDFLGMGIAAQSIEKAKENEIDLLFHFEVFAKEKVRLTESQYQARCRVVNVATGETLGASRLMDRREVTLAARRSSTKAVVEELFQGALDAVDGKAVVQPMPPLAPQHAMSRIDTLLASPQVMRMSRLAEMVMFHHRGLIDQDQLEQVVFFAGGEDGLRLLYAEHEQRLELATSLVLKELGQN